MRYILFLLSPPKDVNLHCTRLYAPNTPMDASDNQHVCGYTEQHNVEQRELRWAPLDK